VWDILQSGCGQAGGNSREGAFAFLRVPIEP